jgi:hypothetical protein
MKLKVVMTRIWSGISYVNSLSWPGRSCRLSASSEPGDSLPPTVSGKVEPPPP